MVLTMSSSLGEAIRQGPVPRVSPEGDRTVVWLSGECDSATITVLAKRLATAIAVDDADLVVDLAEVQFIDAATIGVFIRARNFLRPRSRHLTLRNPPSSPKGYSMCAGWLASSIQRRPTAARR